MTHEPSRADAVLWKLKNHPVVSIVVVVAVIVIGLASFTTALDTLQLRFRGPQPESTLARGGDPVNRDVVQSRYIANFHTWDGRLEFAKFWYATQWKDHFTQERSRDALVTWARNLLDSVDENALLFVHGDDDFFPLVYVQEREGFRPDVQVVHLSLIMLQGYRAWISDTLGIGRITSDPGDETATVRTIVSRTRRPVFFSATALGTAAEGYATRLVREGLVFRLGEKTGERYGVDPDATRRHLERYDYTGVLNPAGEPDLSMETAIRKIIHAHYAYALLEAARGYEMRGDTRVAREMHARAAAFDPMLVGS